MDDCVGKKEGFYIEKDIREKKDIWGGGYVVDVI